MPALKLLLVEDNKEDRENCRSSVSVYCKQKGRAVELLEVETVADGQKALNNTFDGAIVDLKLGSDTDAGGRLVDEIRGTWRVPVAILTGTPNHLEDEQGLLGVYRKGETTYSELLDTFFDVWDTGITRVFGGRGIIEREMVRIFWSSILPSIKAWVAHRGSGKETEAALVRFAVNHLMESLQDDPEQHFPEETYLMPAPASAAIAVSKQLRTGSIVGKKAEGGQNSFIVLTPACDLVVHNGAIKTDRILLCEVEPFDGHYAVKAGQKLWKSATPDGEQVSEEVKQKREGGMRKLRAICSNNHCGFLHFLPRTEGFSGGLINFRKLESIRPGDFDKGFSPPALQVSPFFVKDIVARFAAHYARQGQPDFHFDELAARLLAEQAPPAPVPDVI